MELLKYDHDIDDPAIQALCEIDNVDRLLIKYDLEFPNLKTKNLAKLLNVEEQYIRRRRAKPSYRYAIQKLQGTTDSLMKEAAKKAAVRLLELIDHQNPVIALGAVKIALQKYLNQISDATLDKILVYKSTIAPDGNLLSEIIRDEQSEDKKTIDV